MTVKKKGHWIVYLEWADAVGNSAWIGDLRECKAWANESGYFIKECGFLIEENNQYILFAQRWHPEDLRSEEQYGMIHKIPTTWIRSKKKLMFVEAK